MKLEDHVIISSSLHRFIASSGIPVARASSPPAPVGLARPDMLGRTMLSVDAGTSVRRRRGRNAVVQILSLVEAAAPWGGLVPR